MSKIKVITPFSRIENKDFLIKVLKDKCDWIVLQAENEPVISFPEWVTVKRFDIVNKNNISNRLLNEYFASGLEPEAQYMVLCDDDSVEEGFFDKIPNDDVVCVSMKRGDKATDHVVWTDWYKKEGYIERGIDILLAKPENMKIACVSGEQLIVKGKILKDFRYGLNPCGDGEMVLKIAHEYPVTYVPDAYVLFNYFQDGRFDSFRRKPLVAFIGDFYCAGNPRMGISEWETNISHSLDASGVADVMCFHYDKHYYHTGERGDKVLLEALDKIKPDYVVIVVYKPLGQDPTVISLDTIKAIKTPIISIWGDLEVYEQVELSKQVAPYCYKVIGTANKEIVEGLGYTYMHVPKDPRIFNNPDKERDIDVLFNGSFGYGREERREVLQYLVDKGIKLVAGGSEGGDHFTTEEYADRYKRAKISISFSQARGKNVVNARPFEVMNCGSMLLEQESPELAKLYTEGVDYAVWKTKEDLYEKICYYLNNDEERKSIAINGHKKTQELYSAETFWDKFIK